MIEFCQLSPDSYSDELKKKTDKFTWKLTSLHGKWRPGKSSGGCGNSNPNSFWTNPQYLVTLTDVDPNDNENMATVIISLLQKYTREKRMENNGQATEQHIQFRLFRVKNEADAENTKRTGKKLNSRQLEKCGTSGTYVNKREVTSRFRIPPGTYVVIPSCFEENVSGEFLLRIYTENPVDKENISALRTSGNRRARNHDQKPREREKSKEKGKSSIISPYVPRPYLSAHELYVAISETLQS